MTDCGEAFAHDPHSYRTPKGKIKACDGSLTKRAPSNVRPKVSPLQRHDRTEKTFRRDKQSEWLD